MERGGFPLKHLHAHIEHAQWDRMGTNLENKELFVLPNWGERDLSVTRSKGKEMVAIDSQIWPVTDRYGIRSVRQV